jgi:hypothetical protein
MKARVCLPAVISVAASAAAGLALLPSLAQSRPVFRESSGETIVQYDSMKLAGLGLTLDTRVV